ncbi:MAG: DUF6491 family protein [Oceanicoccus sp.]
MITRILTLSLTAMLFACASSTPAPTPPAQLAQDRGYELGEPVDKIMNYRLDRWNYINPQAVIIHSGVNRDHLVTLRDRCHELMSAEVIATTSTGSAMRARFDAIIVSLDGSRPTNSASNTRKCYIDSIYAISKIKKSDEK